MTAGGTMEATLRGAVWQPLVEEGLEHGLKLIDCFALDKKDKKGRKERRERSNFVDEVLDELDAVQEIAGPGKLLPESDVPLLARLLAEVMAIEMRDGGWRIEDLDKAKALAEAVQAAMCKKGGRALAPDKPGAPDPVALDPVVADRRRQLKQLEAEKAAAVAAEQYEVANQLKTHMKELKLLLVERTNEVGAAAARRTAVEQEALEVNKRYSGQTMVEIFKYTWDQTNQYVRVHVDVPAGIIQEKTTCTFDPDANSDEKQAFSLRTEGKDGRIYTLRRRLKHKIDPDMIGEVVGMINGEMHEGCRIEFPKPTMTRVTVHMTKFVEILSEEDRQQMRELSEKGMMGGMGFSGHTRSREERQDAGLWDVLEVGAPVTVSQFTTCSCTFIVPRHCARACSAV